MIKRILTVCIVFVLSAYLVVAVTAFNRKPDDRICKGVELVVKDKVNYGFITEKGIIQLLKKQQVYQEGKATGTINVRA